MLRVVALFPYPDDPQAFLDNFEHKHLPLVYQIPGLIGGGYGRPKAFGSDRAAHFMIAELDFPDEAAFSAALASEQGQKIMANLSHLSPKGVTLQYFEF